MFEGRSAVNPGLNLFRVSLVFNSKAFSRIPIINLLTKLNLLNIALINQALVVSCFYGSIQSRSEHIKRGWGKVASFVAIFWNVTQRYFAGSVAWHPNYGLRRRQSGGGKGERACQCMNPNKPRQLYSITLSVCVTIIPLAQIVYLNHWMMQF